MTIYRGITHAHSTYSFDGTMSLQEIRTLCLKAGYTFALMTEHVEGMSNDGFGIVIVGNWKRGDAVGSAPSSSEGAGSPSSG